MISGNHRDGLCIRNYPDVGPVLPNKRDKGGMVGLHVVDDEIVNLPLPGLAPDIAYEFVCKFGCRSVYQCSFLVNHKI